MENEWELTKLDKVFTAGTSTESGLQVTQAVHGQSLLKYIIQLIDPNLVGREILDRHPSRRCDIGSENHSKVLEEEKQSVATKFAKDWSGPGI